MIVPFSIRSRRCLGHKSYMRRLNNIIDGHHWVIVHHLWKCCLVYFPIHIFLAVNKYIKFIYSEKATKFCEISTLLLSYVMPVKSKVENSQNFVAFSEYLNFNRLNQNSVSMQVVKSNLDEIRYIFPLLTEFAFTPFNSKSWNQQDLKQY